MSNKSTKSLKGLLAILIIFHHVSQKITTGENFSNFQYMGRYIVALFFFYNGWFINSIIVLYVIFYVSFKKKDSKIAIFKLVFFILVYIFWKVYQNHGDWEYVSIMAFFLGVFWMKDRSLIDKFIEKNYFVFLVSFSILMYVFRHYEEYWDYK